MVTIALAGDVMLGRGVNEVLGKMRPEEPWGDVLPLMTGGHGYPEVDLRIINLECALTTRLQPWTRTPKVFHFRADPSVVSVLQAARIDACSLANNHTLDYEEEGLLDTLRHLDEAGIQHAGAGKDERHAARPVILRAGQEGTRVGLVAVTDNEPAFAAGPDRAGTHYLPVSMEIEVLRRVEDAVGMARAAGAEIVVFSNHWGPNMVMHPSRLFQEFAHAVIDRGADLYYGHSAHLFQGVEIYRGKPILYDTGDFIDDYAVDPVLRNDWSFLFVATLERGSFRRLEMHPVVLSYARVSRATGTEREAILERMEHLSAELGTSLLRAEEHLVAEPG
ncbi:MAG TPA: CapA family protein [Armatimonadota bacterium]|nr:CapA family protein [Armatimonadota bacterium]HOJ21011.1 CapA family protein [Armatimonadota bacterium]HOM83556.1 CapA family protein [Armatimonadota bacterium]HPO74298.1 CapA family protein [Armatimonadota bacterium]HPT99149.1 CapA family protein [Armatimonadota bacterium]